MVSPAMPWDSNPAFSRLWDRTASPAKPSWPTRSPCRHEPASFLDDTFVPMIFRRRWLLLLAPLCLLAWQMGSDGQYPAGLLAGLRWREVGPMRAGRSYAVARHASQPDSFYFGSAGGGVWKTENSGRTWTPISDTGIPIRSLRAVAGAAPPPERVFVGTGEPDIR